MRGCQVGSAEGKREMSPRESVERALHKKGEINRGQVVQGCGRSQDSWVRPCAGSGSGVQVWG